jgi:predicted XRE-type DNA-binding protein
MTRHARPSQKRFADAFDALFEPKEAANLKARAELMDEIVEIVAKQKLTQAQAAARCGISQPRMNDLLKGHIEKFSLDALFNIATALGRRVTIKVSAPRRAA